jgi:CRISPR-associated protein Csb2
VTVVPSVTGATESVRGTAEPPHTVFGEWLVLREVAEPGGRPLALDSTHTEDVTRAVRGALLHHADDPPPAALSGHHPDGRPLDLPHVAFLALPDLATPSSTLLGVAIVLPRDIDTASRQAVLDAVGRWERHGLRLLLGRTGAARLERVVGSDPPGALDPTTWTHPSRRWASVTPVALDQNPGDLFARDPAEAAQAVQRAREIVAVGCEWIGLPRPSSVEVTPRSAFDGAPTAARFMPFPRRGRGFKRVCVHVDLRFGEPVAGPVLLGVGRYYGVGLCRPSRESDGEH